MSEQNEETVQHGHPMPGLICMVNIPASGEGEGGVTHFGPLLIPMGGPQLEAGIVIEISPGIDPPFAKGDKVYYQTGATVEVGGYVYSQINNIICWFPSDG